MGTRELDSSISLIVDDFEPAITRDQFLCFLNCIISSCVINNDNFKVVERLANQRFQTLFNVNPSVENWNHN
jgi:hypothetical protein